MTRPRRCRGDRGDSAPLEAAILAPVLLAVLYFVVAFGRIGSTDTDVTHVARAAARAAATRQTPDAAVDAAHRIAHTTLAARGVACVDLDVAVNTANFVAGGTVQVTVSCVVDLSDTKGVGLPGNRRTTATAIEVIDANRGGP